MTANFKELECRAEYVRKKSAVCQDETCRLLESEADDMTLEIERAWLEGTISAEEEQELSEKLREACRQLSSNLEETGNEANLQ